MLKWLLYRLLVLPLEVLCYLTNWFIVLFCTDNGELKGFLHNWQTWDDSCDSEWYMKNIIAKECKLVDYGFDNYYTGQVEQVIPNTNRKTLVSVRNTKELTTKAKIQRYICRVMWLYRNCCYGFCFDLLGNKIEGTDLTYLVDKENYLFGYNKTKNILFTDWVFKRDDKICDLCFGYCLKWKTFIGWKIVKDSTLPTQSMLATRLMIAISKNDD